MPHSTDEKQSAELDWMPGERLAIATEFQHAIDVTDASYASTLYNNLVPLEYIDWFLHNETVFDPSTMQWCIPPEHVTSRGLLRNAVTGIVSSIFARLASHVTGNGATRCVMDAHEMVLPHSRLGQEHVLEARWSSPDIAVAASGPSFELSSILKEGGPAVYSNLTTCFEVRLDEESAFWTNEQKVYQLGTYAKQIFLHQPNRLFVRCLWITETTVMLVHFDRAGAQYTPALNYHADPRTLVRLVLGLTSYDEADFGLDTSVHWQVQNGFKVAGSITVFPEDGPPIRYPMLNIRPVFMKTGITGVGTICWRVSDPYTGRPLTVKDNWRRLGCQREPEHQLLQRMRGVPGLTQMVSCQDGRGVRVVGNVICPIRMPETRGPSCATVPVNDLKIGSRIVMETYGSSVLGFKSEKQLIGALRDAIAGHRNLLFKDDLRVLHRDISLQNILLGGPDALFGFRAVLIDFDCSMRVPDFGSEVADIGPCGTRFFMSIANLRRDLKEGSTPVTWSDYLDDLEAFLYAIINVMFLMDSPGVSAELGPEFMRNWTSDDFALAAESKIRFFQQESVETWTLSRFWSRTSHRLLQAFFDLIKPFALLKEEYAEEYASDPERQQELYRSFQYDVEKNYAQVLSMFDTALEEIEDRERVAAANKQANFAHQRQFNHFALL